MTREQHDAFTNRVVLTTNATCVAAIWINVLVTPPFSFWLIDGPAVAVLLFVAGFTLRQTRLARRRYEQAVREYLEAGGVVMLVRCGKRWLPVPVPMQRRDLS